MSVSGTRAVQAVAAQVNQNEEATLPLSPKVSLRASEDRYIRAIHGSLHIGPAEDDIAFAKVAVGFEPSFDEPSGGEENITQVDDILWTMDFEFIDGTFDTAALSSRDNTLNIPEPGVEWNDNQDLNVFVALNSASICQGNIVIYYSER